MVSKLVASLLFCVAWLALAAATGDPAPAPGKTGIGWIPSRDLLTLLLSSPSSAAAATAAVQPRLLWFKQHDNKAQTPIIIWQQPHPQTERHHHHHRPDYYYDDEPAWPPRRPSSQSQSPGLSVIVINPNNVQNYTARASGSSSTTSSSSGTSSGSTGTGRIANSQIADLLQRLQNTQSGVLAAGDEPEVITAAEAESDAAAIGAGPAASGITGAGNVAIPAALASFIPQAVNYGEEDARAEDLGDEVEFADLLERQAARGLSPKQLLSFLLQDKRRRRIQEAVAGIYLRNYNLNRKWVGQIEWKRNCCESKSNKLK